MITRRGWPCWSGPRQSMADAAPRTVYSTYGCNMAVRGTAVRAHPERFDTTLPLYGWLEDLDFSRRMAAFGRIVENPQLRGVHLATKTGRISGLRLGYSQIANPVYLVRKGTYHWARALKLMTGNVLANSAKSLWPEPWIDRRGRLTGNLLAFRDLLRGRCRPGRIHDL
ncbi:glycosyltransferase family 2 protein [Rhodophyticola sp.]|uniref:glycosyltransferase family 2 protein n=1 Tax=Rhodophyticola sp. TaxID=2680032 RepID=UPI003D26589A